MTTDYIETARRIIDARNAHDAEKAFSFFTEDASDNVTLFCLKKETRPEHKVKCPANLRSFYKSMSLC